MKTTTSQPFTRPRLRENARIVWALFTKDVLEALKNKNTIAVIFSSLLMVFFYRTLPALSIQGGPPALLVYDAGSSRLVPLLENSRNIELYTYPTEEKMKQVLANGEVPELGLVIPDGFDQALQGGENPELRAYVLHWVNENQAEALRQTAETEISTLLGRQVEINLQGDRVELLPESEGLGVQAAFGLTYVLIMIGVILIPHLMLEEKQNHTLDALTVSPASAGHIVAGKALAGLFYCSLGGAAALVVNRVLVVHWWLALLTVLIGSLFTVSLGLWLGVKIDSRAQLSLWAWVFLLPLIMPVMLSLLEGLIPDVWVRIFSLVPSSAILQLIRASVAGPIPIGKTLSQLAWIAAAAGASLAAVAWILRRRDRETGALSGSWLPSLANLPDKSQSPFATLQKRIARLNPSRADDAPRSPGAGEWTAQTISGTALALPLSPQAVGEALSRPPRPRSSLQMIWIIAAKDLVEALKNRLILSILLGSTFILLSGAALPLLLIPKNLPRLAVYDQGRSALLRGLAVREDFRLGIVDSQDEMERAITGAPDLTLGLVLPADYDQRAGGGQTIELKAFYPHWADPEQLAQRAAFFEQQLTQASWVMVHLDLSGHAVYPPVDLGGRPVMLLLNLVAVILVIGIALVPLLMIEEKEAQTLKALLVSPASLGQVIVGKALVGLFYSLLPALVILLFFGYLFVHWEIAILAVFLTSVLAVAAGLLLGVLSDTPTTASLWSSLLMVFLIGSALMKLFVGLNLSPAVRSALDWLPGSAMMQIFSISQAGEVPSGYLWRDVSALLAAIAVLLILLVWRTRRLEG